MTTPTARATSSRRQHLVTALLVGTVVIVLGVASGIGIDTHAASAPVTPQLNAAPTAPAPTPTHTAEHYFGSAEPPVAPVFAAPLPNIVITTVTPTVAATTATASTSTSPTRAPQSTGTPTVTCSTGLVGGLIDALTGTATSASGGTGGGLLNLDGLLGGLTGSVTSGTSGSGGLLGLLGSTAPQQSVTSASPGDLLSAVTSLLPGVLTTQHASQRPSAALAQSCASDVSSMLPLLGGLL